MISRDEKSAPSELYDLLMDGGWMDVLQQHPTPQVITKNRKIIFINSAAVNLFDGINIESFMGKDIIELIHPLDQERIFLRINALTKQNSQNAPTKIRINTVTNKIKYIISSSALVQVREESIVIATGVDVTKLHKMEKSLKESEDSFKRLFENTHDVFYRTNGQQELMLVGPGAQRLLGYTAKEVIGKPASDYYAHPEERQAVVDAIIKYGEIKDFPAQLRHKRGYVVDVAITSKVILGIQGEILGIEGFFRDTTEEVNYRKQLIKLASTDELTEVLNRRSFFEGANQLIKLVNRYSENCLLVVVDLDYFKEINDRHGHLSGDNILKTIVSLIKESLREADIFGRLGGDEFSIIFRNCTLSEGYEICSRTIKKIKDTKVPMPNKEKVSLSVSLGVTPLTAEDNPFVLALARADRALYLAKTKGRGCFAVSPLDGGEPFLPLHSEWQPL
ncbi:conserved protein of unknown function [Acidithiobacillus ferrivorans]|uniref:diguanylate cyclase n=2 Tax=Acidithiobacillus ferrivorans TaxID=160808 RepID=A0ABY1MQL2_9PROT|nr:GGDEF domain-containing protein [Acidithiobacillus ferrivorans]SMH66052.1 conserved protein of unknown function [Acidithiobacillus ferrivorans]